MPFSTSNETTRDAAARDEALRPATPRITTPRITTPRLRPYRAADLESLILQPAQAHVQAQLAGRGYAQSLEATEAYTFLAQGRVIACLGVYPMHARRALAWGLIAQDCGPHLIALHQAARRWLRLTSYTRIEAHVEAGFAAGARWLQLLGFRCETPQGMRGFTQEGRSCDLYAWVREEGGARARTPQASPHVHSRESGNPVPPSRKRESSPSFQLALRNESPPGSPPARG